MKVDSTTNKFPYSTLMDGDDDLMTMAGMGMVLHGDDSMQSSGNRAEMRKSNKPIMEKRRRARINNCLNELKNILLEAMKKDPARHSKLEKADILELTVRHLQNIQRNQLAIAMATDPTVLHRFKNGFSECVTEVNRYMGRLDGAEPGVRQRLLDHLGNCVNGLQQVGPAPFGSTTTGPVSTFPAAAASFPGAVLPPALGIHSSSPTVVAAMANLRNTTSAATATHIPQQQQTQHPAAAAATAVAFSSDDLNNNLLRSPHHHHHHHHHLHANETSARLMSAFAAASTLPRPRPLSPPTSPPPSLNTSSSSHESPIGGSIPSLLQFSTTSSSRNDSGLSDHSDIGSISRSSSSSNRTSGGSNISGDPLDFSIGKVLGSSSSGGVDVSAYEHNLLRGNNASHLLSSTPVRVVKVEPMQNLPITPNSEESNHLSTSKDMWRPW